MYFNKIDYISWSVRYNAINAYLKEKFGEKVYKVSLEINVTCPVRDGTKGREGCLFCHPKSIHPLSTKTPNLSVKEQLIEGIKYVRKRHGAKKFIAYFQNHSNTYGETERLTKEYTEAIQSPEVVGIAISTRPDCLSDSIIKSLSEINKEKFLWVELGLQTADNDTLKFLRREHTVQDFIDATEKLHREGIAVCAHVILGLPGEHEKSILQTISLINNLHVEGIKIHNLHILKGTAIENLYNEGKIDLISLDEYAKRVVFMLEHLDPKILIHRLNSHSTKELTVAPDWSINKLATFNAVENELKKRNTWQGKKFL